jgi:hypothetical protein
MNPNQTAANPRVEENTHKKAIVLTNDNRANFSTHDRVLRDSRECEVEQLAGERTERRVHFVVDVFDPEDEQVSRFRALDGVQT